MLTITQPRKGGVSRGVTPVLSIGGIEPESIVDGPGFRCAVFVQGCCFSCPGCHNHPLQSFTGGRDVPVEELVAAIENNPLLDGLTLTGGDPFTQAASCAALGEGVRALGLSVMTYTGYTWEALWAANNPEWRRLILATDVLVDGPFMQELRNIELRFRGSSNQRLIDVRRTLAAGKIIVLPEE